MPIFGLNNGLIPIVAFNYGAGKRKRLLSTVKVGAVIAVSIMIVGILIMQILPDQLLKLFDAEEEMLTMGRVALRTISLSFGFAGVCIVLGSTFQALGRGTYSMVVSMARQLVVLIPAAYLLSLTGNVNMVWWAFPLAEIMSLTVTIILFVRIYKKVISKIPE